MSSMFTIDTRGLESPEPLVRILNFVEALASGETLAAQTDHHPILLLESVAGRGYTSDCQEIRHGGYLTTITKS